MEIILELTLSLIYNVVIISSFKIGFMVAEKWGILTRS
jgi:hypothetical protein